MKRYCKNCYWNEVKPGEVCPWCGEAIDTPENCWVNKNSSFGEVLLRIVIVVTAVILLAAALICNVQAAEIPEDRAVRAIIGEASGEGYTGMLAIAGAIRNRGTLQGVYGVKAKHVDKQPQWVWGQARKAWKESASNDITSGADHWGSVTLDAAWINTMRREGFKEAFRYRNHIFFKRVKKG